VEIQVIQRINLLIKQIEHKVYDFTRAEREIKGEVSANFETDRAFERMSYS
jgi:hypothetical protein